jgi:hypothetical protein
MLNVEFSLGSLVNSGISLVILGYLIKLSNNITKVQTTVDLCPNCPKLTKEKSESDLI